jgi:hypothetical protein
MSGVDVGSISIIVMIMVIIFSMIHDPSSIACVIFAIFVLFSIVSLKTKQDTSCDVPMVEEKYDDPSNLEDNSQHEESVDNINDINDESMQTLSDANKYALDQLYGRRGTSIDDKMTGHKKRIGDRDRQATISQIRGRRNNSLEPYYRQELSQHGAKRWWDPDTVLSRKATSEQMKTIMRGPSPHE